MLVVGGVDAASVGTEHLFGYQEIYKNDLSLFPQWLSVLERHIKETTPPGDCESTQFNQCHLKQWRNFLAKVKPLPPAEQIGAVNLYANERPYVLDIENYGIVDYWATPREFLQHNGDCEDYAIFKMLSLKQLGFSVDDMRVVVVQDTNLRISHAVMALNRNDDILILDNQIKQVISHKDIFHYVPVYSVNEKNWWMHLPN
jgi:predicted transglutaminase-like cysteine proteinase